MLRRKIIPVELRPAWEAFQAQAEQVEQARQALLGCLPVGRVEPAPVPVGLDLLRDELVEVRGRLEAWRVSAVEDHWQACRDAVDEALEGVEHAREVATSTGELEELLEAISEVVEPLDAWADAERHWLRLRVRPEPGLSS